MKRVLFILFILLNIIIFSEQFHEMGLTFYSAEGVLPIDNRDYAPNVIKLYNNAEKTIHIFMLEGGYYPRYPNGVNRQMYNALFEAVKRGVEVIVVLDQSGYNPSQSYRNLNLGEFLRENGVKVYYDNPDITLHSKTMIIDSFYTIVGSTNWSYWALDKNNESSIIIKSKEIANIFESYFNDIVSKSHPKMIVIE